MHGAVNFSVRIPKTIGYNPTACHSPAESPYAEDIPPVYAHVRRFVPYARAWIAQQCNASAAQFSYVPRPQFDG